MINCSAEFMQALRNPVKTLYIKLELYDSKMNFLREITKLVTKDDIGRVSVNMDRAIRRSFSFALINTDNSFTWGEDKLIWLDKRVKLFIGLKLVNGTVEYIPQGIFIVSDPYDTHSVDQGKKVYITGQDKAYLMTDKRGKFVNQTKIQAGTNVATAIKIVAQDAGETLFNFDNTDKVTPYELTYSADDNRWKAIQELAKFASCDVYYDVYGYLRLKKIEFEKIENENSVWTYKYGDPTETFYAGNARKLTDTDLANHIRVVGGSGQTATVTFDLVVDESSTSSYTASENFSDKFFYGDFSTTTANETIGLTLKQTGSNLESKSYQQTDFQKGVSSDTIATADGYVALANDYAIKLTGIINSIANGVNGYYYNDIWTGVATIATGDKLVYDIYVDGPATKSGVDGYLQGVGALRDYVPTLVDQNGLALHPSTDLSLKAKKTWYHREFDLSSLDGKQLVSMQSVLEGDAVGTYNSYFRNVLIKDVNGAIKYTIYNGLLLNFNKLQASSNGGTSGHYVNLAMNTTIVSTKLSGHRMSEVYDLSKVGTYADSKISWDSMNKTTNTPVVLSKGDLAWTSTQGTTVTISLDSNDKVDGYSASNKFHIIGSSLTKTNTFAEYTIPSTNLTTCNKISLWFKSSWQDNVAGGWAGTYKLWLYSGATVVAKLDMPQYKKDTWTNAIVNIDKNLTGMGTITKVAFQNQGTFTDTIDVWINGVVAYLDTFNPVWKQIHRGETQWTGLFGSGVVYSLDSTTLINNVTKTNKFILGKDSNGSGSDINSPFAQTDVTPVDLTTSKKIDFWFKSDWQDTSAIGFAGTFKLWLYSNNTVVTKIDMPEFKKDEWCHAIVDLNGALSGMNNITKVGLQNTKMSSGLTVWVSELTAYDDSQGFNTVNMEIRTSTDGGTTWGNWSAITSGFAIPSLTNGTSVTNYRLQFKQTFITDDITFIPKITNFLVSVKSQYISSGEFVSDPFNLLNTSCTATGTTSVKILMNIPFNTTCYNKIRVSTDNGITWGDWRDVVDGALLTEVKQGIDLSQVRVQFKTTMTTSDLTKSPILQSITFNADTKLWENHPYSIQKIGRILYLHNSGSPDPLIVTLNDAKDRAKFELLKRLGYAETISLQIAPMWLHEGGDVITIEDAENSVTGKYRISSFDLPLSPSLMSAECYKYRRVVPDWNAI